MEIFIRVNKKKMEVSVIIPAYDEEKCIKPKPYIYPYNS